MNQHECENVVILIYTYLDFLLCGVLDFASGSCSSSSKSIEMTSSNTTPRAWDFDGVFTGFILAGQQNAKNKLADAFAAVKDAR